jgi:hypothetical protein
MEIDKKTKQRSKILLSLAVSIPILGVCCIGIINILTPFGSWWVVSLIWPFLLISLILINRSCNIKMKAIKRSLGVFTFLLFCSLNFGQQFKEGTPEYYQATGTAPRKAEAIGCKYTPVSSIFDSTMNFKSYEGGVQHGNTMLPLPKVNFLFDKNLIFISVNPGDPKKIIKILGEIDVIKDQYGNYRRFQCEDYSGLPMAVSINDEHGEISIVMMYLNSIYLYYVKPAPIPEKPHDVLDNIEELGVLYDNNFGENVTDEETKAFLRQFGDPNTILNLMLIDLLTTKKHKK